MSHSILNSNKKIDCNNATIMNSKKINDRFGMQFKCYSYSGREPELIYTIKYTLILAEDIPKRDNEHSRLT